MSKVGQKEILTQKHVIQLFKTGLGYDYIPPGVAHKCLDASSDFRCIGAYPPQQKPDWKDGIPGERPEADENIANIVVPELNPIYGTETLWRIIGQADCGMCTTQGDFL